MKRLPLDEIDFKILRELQEHGRLPNVELATRVGLSPAPCLRRMRALEAAGVIRRYATILDPQAVNLSVTVFVHVTLNLQVEGRLDRFEDTIRRRPEVLDCYMMAGGADYLLRVVVASVAEYEQFIKQVLTRIENVASFNSTFGLKEVKHTTVLPLSHAEAIDPRSAKPPEDPPGSSGGLRASGVSPTARTPAGPRRVG